MLNIAPIEVIAGVFTVMSDYQGGQRIIFKQEWFPDRPAMIQTNIAHYRAGSIVGFHYHCFKTSYILASKGLAVAVLVDIRKGSPTEGKIAYIPCSDLKGRPGLYIPPGVAYGYAAHSNITLITQTDSYDTEDELGFAWDDPTVAAQWGIPGDRLKLSDRDMDNLLFADIPIADIPYWDDYE